MTLVGGMVWGTAGSASGGRPPERANECPESLRLAFGAILLLPVEDRHSAYEQLVPYLPDIRLDTQNSSDFLYQINRPRALTKSMPGVQVNRLSKWSALLATGGFIQISPAPIRLDQATMLEAYACHLELDINTDANFGGRLTRDTLPGTFSELADLGKEIVEKGDIP